MWTLLLGTVCFSFFIKCLSPSITFLWCETNLNLINTVSFVHTLCSICYVINLWYLAFELHLHWKRSITNSRFNIWAERESYSSFLSRPWSSTVNCRQAINQFLTSGCEVCLWAVCHIRQRYLRRTLIKACCTVIRPTWPRKVVFNLIPDILLHLVKVVWLNIYSHLWRGLTTKACKILLKDKQNKSWKPCSLYQSKSQLWEGQQNQRHLVGKKSCESFNM